MTKDLNQIEEFAIQINDTPKTESVQVVITSVLDESLWGAIECWDEDGEEAVLRLLQEDINAVVDAGTIRIFRVRNQ